MEPYAYIRELAAKDRLAHAWLILGGEAKEREKLALFAAQALLCTGEGARPCGRCAACVKLRKGIHPDYTVLLRDPEKKEIPVSEIRTLRQEAWVLPNEGKRRVFFLPEADRMNGSAQNALLKVLEEPPAHAAFLLGGEEPGPFLPTIRSRCLTLRLTPGEAEAAAGEKAAALAEAWVRGDRLAFAAAALPCEKLDREKFDRLLEELSLAAALRARAGEGALRENALLLFRRVETLREMRRVNVSAGHCLGWLAAVLGERDDPASRFLE